VRKNMIARGRKVKTRRSSAGVWERSVRRCLANGKRRRGRGTYDSRQFLTGKRFADPPGGNLHTKGRKGQPVGKHKGRGG